MPPRRGALALALALHGCTPRAKDSEASRPDAQALPPAEAALATAVPDAPTRLRAQRDGHDFPDHVLALTWDDGPDSGTLALARYLAGRHVAATFFVVQAWKPGVSEEPGEGKGRFETGYAAMPVLGDLLALGHRLGNHTENHVLLAGAPALTVTSQLGDNQRGIDPFLTSETRLFRAPGGAWDDAASKATDADPSLADLVGPIRWDIDGKDWEGSLFCRSDHPADECEPGTTGRSRRVRAEVTARRYLDQVARVGHGIVLFHDRVGDVGSDYALRVARIVLPELDAAGYVFAPPVLELSPFRTRTADAATAGWVATVDPETVRFADVDGDGRTDLCGAGADRVVRCARSVQEPAGGGPRRTSFALLADGSHGQPRPRGAEVPRRLRGDLNGDGREDTCELAPDGVRCALAGPHGPLTPSVWVAREREDAARWLGGTLSMADVNGDGRADLCSVAGGRVACALAP